MFGIVMRFIETASRDEVAALQLERLRWSLQHAYDNVPHYRAKFDAKGQQARPTCDNYPFGLFAVPREGGTGACLVGHHGQTHGGLHAGRHRPLGRWWPAASAAGGRPGDVHVAYGYGLFLRRAGCALRGRACRSVRHPHVGRADRETGATDSGLQARHHHGHALVLAGDCRGVCPPGCGPRGHLAQGGHFRCRAPGAKGMRSQIERSLGLDAVDIYGLSEVMGPGVASECIRAKDGPVIWEDHFYPEIVNPETGEPVADGEEGELVFTRSISSIILS